MKNVTIYGIPNCDVTKKTFDWFNKKKIPFEFHNYKTEGISEAKLKSWDKKQGWESFFNKRSSTWKLVAESYSENVSTLAEAIKIMQEHNSIIKRPVIEVNDNLLIGYDEKKFQQNLINNHS